ncbi:hypothetical protein GCM10027159_07960 [Lysobacter terrae]
MSIRIGARGSLRWRFVFALLFALTSLQAGAVSKVDPGEEPRLAPDEGLLVVSVDSDVGLASMRFRNEGGSWGNGYLRGIKEGRTTQLYRLPAGRYHWTKILIFDTWSWSGSFDLSKNDEFAFEVKPGQINYAGDVVYRAAGFLSADMRLSNRALPVLDWLQAKHPALTAKLPFAYSGYYPDPFPAFYLEAKRSAANVPGDLDAGRTAPKPEALPLPPKLLWKEGRVDDVALSADGQWVVEAVHEQPERWALGIFDANKGTGQRLVASDAPFEDIRWESDRILLATTRSVVGTWLHAFHISQSTDGKFTIKRVDGPVGGDLVDVLPAEPGVVLYQRRDQKGQLVVHRLDLNSEEGTKVFKRARSRERLNLGVANDLHWFADGSGRLRMAFARKGEDDVALMHGQDGVYREVLSYRANSGFQPLQLSYDGNLIYGFTDEERGQRDLVAFDPAQGKIVQTVYSKPGVDLVSAVFDDRRKPIGATYYAQGLLVTDYFDEAGRHLEKMLHAAFPGQTVTAIRRSRDASQMLLWVDGSDRPPQVYLLDTVKRQAQLFDDLLPDLAGRKFARADVLKVHGSDGLPVEAFLTLPDGEGKRPLVVMPHGGPIGISDDLHFNREVQFLASLGYAVLQVNFRGSEGYGKAFREAGYRNYGKLIEDDIDAAIKAALASYPLDESKMCAVGTSYGGYSAMVAAIRWPQRFRCVVSISGVSDRALFFTSSDSGRDAETRKLMERTIGNPSVPAELSDMQATSPLYRYQDLKVPVMLVHGGEDARVDMEHTRRLVRLLNLAGRPPVLLTFKNEGHGVEQLDNRDQAWSSIAGFLGEYLGRAKVAASPATTPAAAAAPQGK